MYAGAGASSVGVGEGVGAGRCCGGITLSLSMSDPGAQKGVSCVYQ